MQVDELVEAGYVGPLWPHPPHAYQESGEVWKELGVNTLTM